MAQICDVLPRAKKRVTHMGGVSLLLGHWEVILRLLAHADFPTTMSTHFCKVQLHISDANFLASSFI